MADVHVGGGRVDPELDDKLAPFAACNRQLAGQVFGGREEFLRPGRDQRGLLGRGQVGQVNGPPFAEQSEDPFKFGSFAEFWRFAQDGHERGVGGTEPGAFGDHRGFLFKVER